ncbi:MAG: hypothetical protein OEN23_08235 [Paracoccaceae bacterium]|nr:hypothetical protein [Paracoccaceae bacterium]
MDYQVVHEQTYDYAISSLPTVTLQQAEEAVGAISYALSRNPKGFRKVRDPDVYLAKIAPRPRDHLPGFRVWFRVSSDDKHVYLLYINEY